ncbi:unnamed protein product [Arctogadus glacialis]
MTFSLHTLQPVQLKCWRGERIGQTLLIDGGGVLALTHSSMTTASNVHQRTPHGSQEPAVLTSCSSSHVRPVQSDPQCSEEYTDLESTSQGVSPGDMMCTILYHLETCALSSTAAVIWRPVHYPLPSGDLGTNLYHLVSSILCYCLHLETCALSSTAGPAYAAPPPQAESLNMREEGELSAFYLVCARKRQQ